MREILFRAKTKANKEWVYGHFAKQYDVPQIYTGNGHECIYEDTLCQYTGLTDKNGVKIFEGDIVKCVSRLDYANMIVIFEDGEFRMVKCEDYKTYTTGNGYFSVRCFHKEVIGNIYDNPELIGGEKQ